MYFYRALARPDFQTDVAIGYKQRFERNLGKLFTFLDHDGTPWNNNNAEHAVKAVVKLRRTIGGKCSVNGIKDYPILLSVSETCKCRGVSFLYFLKSGRHLFHWGIRQVEASGLVSNWPLIRELL